MTASPSTCFTQIGRALRGPGSRSALGGLVPERVAAIGESQSAFFLTTYIDAVHPTAQAFDGFFVHSRGASGASLEGAPMGATDVPRGLQIRGDVDVPVFVFETETDLGPLLDYGPARQPDTDRIRTWEVAGTAHADAYVVGGFARLLGCDFMVNEGPQHFVAKAALVALNRWMTEGSLPPTAPPLQLSRPDPPELARDHLGNAIGGVRTPDVDVPVAALSGEAPPVSAACARSSGRRFHSSRASSSTCTATRAVTRGVHRQFGRHHRVGVPTRVRPGRAVGTGRGRRVPVVTRRRRCTGGGGGIRTHGGLATTTVFETVRFVHSRTPPTGLSRFHSPASWPVSAGTAAIVGTRSANRTGTTT